MADSSVQRKAEEWVVKEALPSLFKGKTFKKGKLPLVWGGSFAFDAVSTDGTVVACISTSSAQTASEKLAVGKIHKIKADTLYLLNAQGVKERVLVFTDPTMMEYFRKQRESGRFPSESQIHTRLVELPPVLAEELRAARDVASAEVRPNRE